MESAYKFVVELRQGSQSKHNGIKEICETELDVYSTLRKYNLELFRIDIRYKKVWLKETAKGVK